MLIKRAQTTLKKNDEVLKKALGKDIYTGNELNDYVTKSDEEKKERKNLPPILYNINKAIP